MKMSSKKILIVEDGCPVCPLVLKRLRENGQIENVRVINSTAGEGAVFADSHGVKMIPECLVDEDGQIRKCSDEEWRDLTRKSSKPSDVLFELSFKPE